VFGKDGIARHYEGSQECDVSARVFAVVYCNDFFTADVRVKVQSQNISTVSNIPNNRTVIFPNVSDALSNHSSRFLNL
jgi:hypothetical protein